MAINSLVTRPLFGAVAVGAVLALGVLGGPLQVAGDAAQALDDVGKSASNAAAAAPVDGASPAPAPEGVTPGNPLQAIPISRLSATRDRPLFSASRRPPPLAVAVVPPPPPPTVSSAAPEAPPFTLVGTIIGEHDRIGIFLNEAAKIAVRIREGGRDSGWTLRSLDPRSAVLEGDGRMVTLGMLRPNPTGTGAPDGTVAPGTSVAPRVSGIVRPRNAARGNGDGL